MKIPGTNLTLPVPAGYEMVVVDSTTVEVRTIKPFTRCKTWASDREYTETIRVTYDGDGLHRTCRWIRNYMYEDGHWENNYQTWVPSGDPPKRTRKNTKNMLCDALFWLANGGAGK